MLTFLCKLYYYFWFMFIILCLLFYVFLFMSAGLCLRFYVYSFMLINTLFVSSLPPPCSGGRKARDPHPCESASIHAAFPWISPAYRPRAPLCRYWRESPAQRPRGQTASFPALLLSFFRTVSWCFFSFPACLQRNNFIYLIYSNKQ